MERESGEVNSDIVRGTPNRSRCRDHSSFFDYIVIADLCLVSVSLYWSSTTRRLYSGQKPKPKALLVRRRSSMETWRSGRGEFDARPS